MSSRHRSSVASQRRKLGQSPSSKQPQWGVPPRLHAPLLDAGGQSAGEVHGTSVWSRHTVTSGQLPPGLLHTPCVYRHFPAAGHSLLAWHKPAVSRHEPVWGEQSSSLAHAVVGATEQ